MAQNWPFSENLSKLKICQILIFFLFSDRFYDGNKYLTAYNHLSHESYWFWSLLNFHDFRHYIYYSIYTKCQIGKAKPSPRTERFSVLESLGPMEWETGVTAIDFKLFLFCATLNYTDLGIRMKLSYCSFFRDENIHDLYPWEGIFLTL